MFTNDALIAIRELIGRAPIKGSESLVVANIFNLLNEQIKPEEPKEPEEQPK